MTVGPKSGLFTLVLFEECPCSVVIRASVQKRISGNTLRFSQHAQEEVLGADGGDVQAPGLSMRQDKDPASIISEMLEHPTRVPESADRITPMTTPSSASAGVCKRRVGFQPLQSVFVTCQPLP